MSTEDESVLEEKLIKHLKIKGYESVSIRDENDLKINLREQIERFNSKKLRDIPLSDNEFRRIYNHLNQGTIFDRAEKLRDQFVLIRDDESSVRIDFLNTKDYCKNIFQVSNQITMIRKYENRYDVTLLVNGLPLIQIELKRERMEIGQAFNQIKRYMQDSYYDSLFNYIQLFVITNGVNTRYFANNEANKINFEFTFNWKDKENNNILPLNKFTDCFLERCMLVKIISRYMVLNEASDSLMVLRPYQIHAIERVLERVEANGNGYVWHTTGSGKTLTSFKLSQLLAKREDVDKVVFVVDRKDLDSQTNEEFNKFSKNCVTAINNTREVVKVLTTSESKLYVTSINKLSKAVTEKRYKSEMDKIKDKRFIFIYDECHRSQFGKMHQAIDQFFTNKLHFGFTGTPIFPANKSPTGQTTAYVFDELLHSYKIQDAIADGSVLGFDFQCYSTMKLKEHIQDLMVKGINTSELFRSKDRINLIVDFVIASYNIKTRDRKFNAMFAVSQKNRDDDDKGLIHKYYKLFKEKKQERLHDLKVVTIFSVQDNEDAVGDSATSRALLAEYIKDYNEMFDTQFSLETTDEYRDDISKRMKKREIDLLLVVDMFLTGFDCPMLNTLYVDKNLEYHKMIQAFSRTNRLVDKTKYCGNILCFRNLEDNFNKALALFSNPQDIDKILMKSYDFYVEKFNKDVVDFYTVVKTVDDYGQIKSETKKKDFAIKFRKLIRTKSKLDTFIEFSFDDLDMSEEDFNGFTSHYRDLARSRKINYDEKVSVSDDVDYEISLITNINVNFDYIMNLIPEVIGDDFEDRVEEIISKVKESKYYYKSELIRRFIYKYAGEGSGLPVEESYRDFINDEKEKEFQDFASKENLDVEMFKEIYKNYLYSRKFVDEDIEMCFVDKSLEFLLRQDKIEVCKDKILYLIKQYC